MTRIFRFIILAALICGVSAGTAAAQKKAPDYKIGKIKIVPFDSATGEFQSEFVPNDERTFFNDLSISLLVLVEIDGQAGSFEVGRKINIKVTEGKRVKATRTEQIGLLGEGGKWFEALWLTPSMCDEVTITASITGQRPTKSMTRKVPFMCGE